MREIRLRWKDRVSHAEHEIEAHARWTRASAEIRRDLEIIVRTANELYGPRSHWIEEREARQPDRKARLRFDKRVLQGDAAASPYARQLIAGFPRLRFDAPLERDYADHLRDSQRRPALACGWLALVLWLAWAGVSVHAAAPVGWWVSRGVVAATLGAGIYLFATRRFFVRTDRVALTLWLPLAAVTILQAFLDPVAGLSHGRFAALLVVVAAFFPVGLLLVQSLGAVLLVLAGCTFAALVRLPSAALGETLAFAGLLLSTAAFCAVGAYFREHSQREQFLLHELLSRQAYIDPMTGLQNRRGTDHLTQIARLQAIRDGVRLSFVVIAIDHFSQYNERFGRDAGDATLMQVTKILSAFARRPLDVASRLGGNAFGLLLYDCELEQARLHAEHLREALHAVRIDHGEGTDAPATLSTSMGAVELPPRAACPRGGRSPRPSRRRPARRPRWRDHSLIPPLADATSGCANAESVR